MRQRRRWIPWAIAIASFVMIVVSGAIDAALQSNYVLLTIVVILASAAWAAVGAVITSRTGNRIGWVLLGVVGLTALSLGGQTYATLSLTTLDHRLPGDELIGLLNQVAFFVMLALIVAVPLLYPTGHPRWRWVWRVYLASLIAVGIGWLLLPQQLSLAVDSDTFVAPDSPIGLHAFGGVLGTLLGVASIGVLVAGVLGVVSLALRYREAEGDARQQIRWLAYVGVVSVTGVLLTLVSVGVLGDPPAPGLPTIVSNLVFALTLLSIVFGIPVACGIAILRYHLYDLDVVIKKALVALVLALMLGTIGLGAFALAGQFAVSQGTPEEFTIVVGLGLGVLVVPTLRLSRRIADRIVYGRRATPYEVLASFSGSVGEAYSSDDVLPRMAMILCEGAGAASARVLVHVGDEQRQASRAGVVTGEEFVTPVLFQGEAVGALAVSFPPNDPLDAKRRELIEHLASQAGPVVRNVRLIEELRASRQRLVAAQNEERRRLERNIHDGVQQQLVALNVHLGLLGTTIDRDAAAAAAMARELQSRTTEALEDLRDLARGIYPPLLADKGLAAALQAQARKAAVATTVQVDGIGRYDQAVESAVYFCSLEALNNVAKYANADTATVTLVGNDGHLTFTVTDDGDGFDAGVTSYGTGLQGMADRLDAIGGRLHVTSRRGSGTIVTGTVPVEA